MHQPCSSPLRSLALALALAGVAAPAAEKKSYPSIGTIERLDTAFDRLVPPGARIVKLAEGFVWSEGPVWIRSGGFVVFSDVPKNVVHKWKEGEGLTEYLRPSGYGGFTPRGGEPGSNGLTVDSNGNLILCEHGDRRITRLEKDRTKTTLAATFRGKRLNSPNDLCFKSNGDLYFTDPPYGLEKNMADPQKELAFQGVYRLSKSGEVTLLTSELSRPNGIAFSPDEKTLYVAVSDPQKAVWMAYDVQPDGTIENGRIFYDATKWVSEKKGLPDGLKVDLQGNIFATGPGGVLVFTPGAKLLGISAKSKTGNLWGHLHHFNRFCRGESGWLSASENTSAV